MNTPFILIPVNDRQVQIWQKGVEGRETDYLLFEITIKHIPSLINLLKNYHPNNEHEQ